VAQTIGQMGTPVGDVFNLAAVEAALGSLWSHENQAGANDTIRACAVNFVIPIAPGSLDAWQVRLAEIARLVPSRILVLERAPEDWRPPIDAVVTATCHRRKGGLLVCSEMVHIKSVPQACRRLPSICRALSVSDLPLLLLALDDSKLEAESVRALFDMADLAVTDSSVRSDQTEAVYCDGDLMWQRLRPWRSAVGHFLGSCMEFRTPLVTHIRVQGQPASAPMLGGWIGYLLHGEVRRDDSGTGIRIAGGGTVKVECVEGSGQMCGIDGVDIIMSHDDHVSFMAIGDQMTVTAHLCDHDIRSDQALHPLTFAEEVAGIVHGQGADSVYAQARRLALAIPASRPRA
jgi:glucose-6-phosphate dehydrogenase assembly protein OpcA